MSEEQSWLEARRHEVATCTFCPKLCRFACPVAEAECRETVTPWGLMTRLDDVGSGRAPLDEETAELMLHCTGCRRCQQVCKHGNDVFSTLLDARAAAGRAGLAPEALTVWGEAEPLLTPSFESLPREGSLRLLPGFAEEATVAAALRLLDAGGETPCRGEVHHAGDRLLEAGLLEAHATHVVRLGVDLEGASRVVCLDPGDAVALRERLGVRALHLSEVLVDLRGLRVVVEGDVLYLDACRLGRGLGVYEPPRALLGQVVGGVVREAFMHHAEGGCCGAGAGYLAVHPAGAKQVAVEAAEDEPDLPVVIAGVACAAHLAASLDRPVHDWTRLVAAGLEG